MKNSRYFIENKKVPYIDISNCSAYSDDKENKILSQKSKHYFNFFKYNSSQLNQKAFDNELSLSLDEHFFNNPNKLKNKRSVTYKKHLPSKDLKILKINLLTEKNKIIFDSSLLKKARNICLKIKKRKLAKSEKLGKNLKISSSDCKKNKEIKNKQYNTPEKKSYSDYNKKINYHKYKRNKTIISVGNYNGKNLMDLFVKVNVNDDENNNNKKFPEIENKFNIKKNIFSNHNNNLLKFSNLLNRNRYNINNIKKQNFEQIKKLTNPLIKSKKRLISCDNRKKILNANNYNQKIGNKIKSLPINSGISNFYKDI